MALEQFFGRIVDMVRRTEGDELAVAASVGATTLYVGDTSDFDETGGQILFGGDVYTYDEVDHDANTLHLTTATTVAGAVGDPVDAFDEELGQAAVEYVANILLDDQDTDDEPIEVTVSHALVPMLEEKVRGAATESVTLVRDGDDDMVIWQVDGKLAVDLLADAAVEAAAQAASDALNALTEAQLAQAIADGAVDIYYQTSAPWANGSTAHDDDLGDVWVDTDAGSPTAYRWLNRTWTLIGEASVVQALLAAQSAQTTADGKIRLFVQNTTPTADGYGDIWRKPSEDNKEYYWDGDSWEPLILGSGGIGSTLTNKSIVGGSLDIGSGNFTVSSSGVLELDSGQYSIFRDGIYAEGTSGRPSMRAFHGVQIDGAGPLSAALKVTSGGIDVTGGSSFSGNVTAGGELHGDSLYCDTIDTTANAANVYMGAAGKLQKSTSSKRYKKNIRNAGLSIEAVLGLKPRRYQSRSKADGTGWHVGFVAEEAHDLGLTEFVIYDDRGRPDGFAYPTFTSALLAVCQAQQAQIDNLTARLDAAGL